MNSFTGDALFGSKIALDVCSCVLLLLDGDGSAFVTGMSILEVGNTIGVLYLKVVFMLDWGTISMGDDCFLSIFIQIYICSIFVQSFFAK